MQILLRATFLFALLFAGVLSAQVAELEKQMPPIKVATKLDDKGQKQWDVSPHQNCPACKAKKVLKCTHCDHLDKPEQCPECKLTRKAPCHYCAGTGALPDPLELAPCPGCRGHSVVLCFFCGNKGKIFFTSGGKSGQKCNVCKGHAGVPCTVCDGQRMVPAAFKGKLAQQKLKKLLQAKANLTKFMTQLESFDPTGAKTRDERKKFAAMFKKVRSDFPPLKDVSGFVDDIIKKLENPRIKDNDKDLQRMWRLAKSNILFYALHQSKVIDLCIERAEFNEKPAAPKKQG